MADDFFADIKKKKRERMDRFSKCSVVEIVGLVGPTGPSGAKLQGEVKWTASFSLAAWRLPNGSIVKIPLSIESEVTEKELKELQNQINANDVVRLHLRLLDDVGKKWGLLAKVVGSENSDRELLSLAAEALKPVTLHDTQFGDFTLDRRLNWFETTTMWKSTPAKLYLSLDECEDNNELFATARALWNPQNQWNERIIHFAVDNLLKLKNSSWLDDDEEPVTAEDFKKRMELESIVVYPGGDFQFLYRDGDMFAGHSIQICGSLKNGPESVDLPG